jgi:hypothetical protein
MRCNCKTKLGAQCKNAAKPGGNRCGTHTRHMCTTFPPFQQSARAQRVSEIYEILDNGGTPYKVMVDRNEKIVIVRIGFNNHVLYYDYKEIFLGEKLDFPGREMVTLTYDGSSILLKTGKYKYILISSTITEFTTENDEIVMFGSPISGTVAYPYAIGKKNTYDLINMVYKDNKHVDQDILNLKMDAYGIGGPGAGALPYKTLHTPE